MPPTVHWTRERRISVPHPAGWSPSGIARLQQRRHQRSCLVQRIDRQPRHLEAQQRPVGRQHRCRFASAGYQPAGFADFNNDGTSDVLWYNPTTRNVDMWKIANGQWAGSVNIGSHPAGWQPAGVGDFNGTAPATSSGTIRRTGNAEIWKTQNGEWAGSVDLGNHPAGWQPSAVGDFNGDGTDDIAGTMRRPAISISGRSRTGSGPAVSISVRIRPDGSRSAPATSTRTAPATSSGTIPTTNNVDIWLITDGHWAGSIDVGSHPGRMQLRLASATSTTTVSRHHVEQQRQRHRQLDAGPHLQASSSKSALDLVRVIGPRPCARVMTAD